MQKPKEKISLIDVLVIGGGASGLAAAGSAAASGKKVVLLEKNEKCGKKLYVTGKGRCNVTNDCEPREFLLKVVRGGKFLQSAVYRFPPAYTVSLLDELGLKTKVERGGRVFPVSDKSSDVIKALNAYAKKGGAETELGVKVRSVKKTGDFFMVTTADRVYESRAVIIACGGKSYTATGSDGDGYGFASKLGHKIVPLVPALVPIKLKENVLPIEGLSLKNVSVRVYGDGVDRKEFGEMLFTSFGASGPTVLTLSSFINRVKTKGLTLSIDLKPALSEQTLDQRVLSDFKKYENKQLRNALFDLLPRSLVPYMIDYCALPADKPVNTVTAAERLRLVSGLKNFSFTVDGLCDMDGAIVTSGGVELGEINPSTMESKLVEDLYFVGETLDVDALTGGFNIQIALSTGFAAGFAAGSK